MIFGLVKVIASCCMIFFGAYSSCCLVGMLNVYSTANLLDSVNVGNVLHDVECIVADKN